MSTAARKARKRAHIKFERTPKVRTQEYETRAQGQERRRPDRKADSIASSVVASLIRGRWGRR